MDLTKQYAKAFIESRKLTKVPLIKNLSMNFIRSLKTVDDTAFNTHLRRDELKPLLRRRYRVLTNTFSSISKISVSGPLFAYISLVTSVLGLCIALYLCYKIHNLSRLLLIL